jgi:hypothetical protein
MEEGSSVETFGFGVQQEVGEGRKKESFRQ